MEIDGVHLTYCTNIHPGQKWKTHFEELKKHLPEIKAQVAPEQKMGIGLRVSHHMSLDLMDERTLNEFRDWLDDHDLYVFTLNGFPYGNFHHAVIKDEVHKPDWTIPERFEYTIRLFDILASLLPDDLKEGGISTSPLSYRHWYQSESDRLFAIEKATQQIIEIAEYLHGLYKSTGKVLHLDLEPEPDGLIENGEEFINWYEEILLPTAQNALISSGLHISKSDEIIRRHIRLCYDVCHMAVEFENQVDLVNELQQKQISIGKIQLSSALRLLPETPPEMLQPFIEPQYLHQVVVLDRDGDLHKFPDLPQALESRDIRGEEWRVHFHVPLFTDQYGPLRSTRPYVDEILALHKKEHLTRHFELETYTWEVLPEDLKLPIGDSIIREFESVLPHF